MDILTTERKGYTYDDMTRRERHPPYKNVGGISLFKR
jgi:hypothetical protein